MARKILDYLYGIAGILAALSMVAMMLLVLAQIIARQFHSHIPSSDDMIGFLVVWASFLGLAYTMHKQQHIRVELVVGRLNKSSRKWVDIAVGLFAVVMLMVFSYYVIALIHESWSYDDQTGGEIPMPLWLMQLPMGIGCVLFTLSMLDYTVQQFGKPADDSLSIEG